MPDTERVELAFGARRKRGEAVLLLDGVQLGAAPGQHLVRVGLVADVPHDAIVRRLVDIMERNGELDRAQPGRKMAAARGDVLDEKVSQLRGELRQLRNGESLDVVGRFDPREERILVRLAGHCAQVYTGCTRRLADSAVVPRRPSRAGKQDRERRAIVAESGWGYCARLTT